MVKDASAFPLNMLLHPWNVDIAFFNEGHGEAYNLFFNLDINPINKDNFETLPRLH